MDIGIPSSEGVKILSFSLSAGREYDVGIRASSAALPSHARQVVELRLRSQL